nr:efflux RND transporter periplasmic adaptor subunit [uncultured Niameybacter sp.]
MKKYMWYIGIFILNICILIFIYRDYMKLTREPKEKEVEPIPITAYTVDTDEITTYVFYQGIIEKEKAFIVPSISGKVTQIHVEEEDLVEEGTKLISFDTGEIEIELEKIKETIEQFKGFKEALGTRTEETLKMIKKLNRQIEEVESHLDRLYKEQSSMYADKPYKKNIIALEEELNALKTLKKTLEVVHPEIEDSSKSLVFLEEIYNKWISLKDKYEMTSPIKGRIEKINIQVGERPKPFLPIVNVVNEEKQKLIIDLPKSYINEYEIGELSEVEVIDTKMHSYMAKGKIEEMTSKDDSDNIYTVTFNLQMPEERTLEGICGKIKLPLETSSKLVIPQEALIRTANKNYVYVLEETIPYRVKRRSLKLGIEDDGRVEVLEGLLKGDQIVLEGNTVVQDGSIVQIVSTKPRNEFIDKEAYIK